MDRGIGKWILPQPEDAIEYVSIPRYRNSKAPFGYKIDEENEEWLLPIPLELEALEQAKKHLKQYTYKEVAAWLTTRTKRSITPAGLRHRINNEQSSKRKASTFRELARKYERALRQAEIYEEKIKNIQGSRSSAPTSAYPN